MLNDVLNHNFIDDQIVHSTDNVSNHMSSVFNDILFVPQIELRFVVRVFETLFQSSKSFCVDHAIHRLDSFMFGLPLLNSLG